MNDLIRDRASRVSAPRPTCYWPVLQVLTLVSAGVAIYWPALHGDWLWDDQREITRNPAVASAVALFRSWTGTVGEDYLPLLDTIIWVEWRLWGANPLGYHLATLGFHLVAALLFWRLLHRLGVSCAWFGAMVFVTHPLTVNSVAWIAEQKNTTSLCFLLPALLVYLRFDATRRVARLVASLILFTAAMLCKSSVVMLPFVLLLLTWWKHGRIARRALVSAAPFFAVALLLGLVTVQFQHHRAMGETVIDAGDLTTRLARAGIALSFYFWKCVLPTGLVPVYSRWSTDQLLTPMALLPWIGVALVLAISWRYRTTWGQHLLLGLGFFALNLVPVLGFITMAFMRHAWVSDHFAYISLLGVCGLLAAVVAGILRRLAARQRVAVFLLAGAVPLAGAWASHRLAANYRDEATFWTFTLARNPRAWVAHARLGDWYFHRGDAPRALAHYRQALPLNPRESSIHFNLANTLLAVGRIAEAITYYTEAVALRPRAADARLNLGDALLHLGRSGEALPHLRAAVEIEPNAADARLSLANALLETGHAAEALPHYREALRRNPRHPEALANNAAALAAVGRYAEALPHAEAVVRLEPSSARLRINLAVLLTRLGRSDEAVPHLEEALRLDPGSEDARSVLQQIRARPRGP